MSDVAKNPPIFQIPERMCALWCGFAAFVFAFGVRLVSSGEVLSALFAACVACLAACWIGRLASGYLNANLQPETLPEEPSDDGDTSPSAP